MSSYDVNTVKHLLPRRGQTTVKLVFDEGGPISPINVHAVIFPDGRWDNVNGWTPAPTSKK